MKGMIILIKKILCVLSAVCMMFGICITASANEIKEENLTSDNAVVYSTGLISGWTISLSSSGNTIYLSGNTNCFDTMKSVGFKKIVLQRSSNGTSWSTYKTFDDVLNSSSDVCKISSKSLGTVPTGYYYRVTCTHYAKETGLFGKSESISNTSNSVKVS